MSERTVLVVDDSELIRAAARIGMSSNGWRVLTAESGAEGIEIAARERPDAILLDLVMPEQDGAATLQALREQPDTAELPVIVLTASTDQAPTAVAGVISKPFAPAALAGQVAKLLGWE